MDMFVGSITTSAQRGGVMWPIVVGVLRDVTKA